MAYRPVPRQRLKKPFLPTNGLTTAEAMEARQAYGPNDIVESPPHPWWNLLRETAQDPMLWFLAGVGILYAVIGQTTEAITLLVAILPLIGMDLFLHRRTQASTASLSSRLAATATVVRDGTTVCIAAREVVPGDLLIVSSSEPFAADGIVVGGAGIQVDESALTGEAYPVAKQPLHTVSTGDDDPPVDDQHWGFAGTRLLTGEARLLVIHTGSETTYGEIVQSATCSAHGATPLQTAIGQLVKILVFVALLVCIALAAVRLSQGFGWLDALVTAVTLATAAIPEEFSVVFTFLLGVGVFRMARRQALVRRAVTVENIGRVSYICSDKTGTITEGQLRLEHLLPAPPYDEKQLLRYAAMASRAESRDPMDEAILRITTEKGAAAPQPDIIRTFPFTEDRKRETALARTQEGASLAATKGAVEVVLAMSTLDVPQRASWNEEVSRLAEGAHKVVAVACREVASASVETVEPDSAFEFVGLLAFEDPVREGVQQAVHECQLAEIHPIMVTGDHPQTALAVAKSVGIGGESPRLITGDELEAQASSRPAGDLRHVDVIARAKPAQKLMLVKNLQISGEIVAVTGDGVNDVPALQAADVGVAMGERGTRSAREVAAIVLLDDNFRTIVGAIREGRQLFQNLRASFQYLLIVHIPFVATATLIPLLGYPLLWLPVHIVLLELMIHPTAMLAFQTPADRILGRRSQGAGRARFFDATDWLVIVAVGTLIAVMVIAGYLRSLEGKSNVEHGRAMALATFAWTSASVAAGLNRLRTRASWWTTGATLVGTLLLIQTPTLDHLLHMQALHLDDWLLVALAAALVSGLPVAIGFFRKNATANSP